MPLTIALPLIVLLGAGSPQQPTLSCKPADSLSSNFLENVKEVFRPTDSASVALRQSMGLSGVTVSHLTPITSGQVCARLAGALNQLAGTATANRAVYVIKAGTKHYFVWDPNATASQHALHFVFDSKYKLIKALLI